MTIWPRLAWWPVQTPPSVDLQTQLESLWDCVFDAEKDWRFDDRLDLALGVRRR